MLYIYGIVYGIRGLINMYSSMCIGMYSVYV